MTRKEYELEDEISKTTEDVRLWEAEKGVIEIKKNTLAIPVKLDDEQRGYVFHGEGKLLLDAIAETEAGAIGEPIERRLDKPFLSLGNTGTLDDRLNTASREDLSRMGYEDKEGILSKAEDLCEQFFGRRRHGCRDLSFNHGLVFAFPNETDELDVLVAKDSKLVYKGTDIVFVSNRDNVVLKSSDHQVVCSSNGKSVFIKR